MSSEKRLEVQEMFERAQKPHGDKSKLVAALKKRYLAQEDKSAFLEEFLRCLRYAMIVYTREPSVESVVDFAAKFAVSLEDDGDDGTSFLEHLLDFLLEAHPANSHAVRFRACQMLNKVLGGLSENAQLDDELCEKIHEAMLVRVADKYPNVRIQAALAMARLQDPGDPRCPTTKAYLLLLDNDSNAEVRRAVLSCVAPSAASLPKIYRRTRDVKEKVRKLAYQVLAEKIHIQALTIAQRVSLLQQGFNDSTDAVKDVVKLRLLPAWLRQLQDDVLKLLHKLDVENCGDTAVEALHALFSTARVPEDRVPSLVPLDERKLIPAHALTCENVVFWRAACQFWKAKGDDGEELLEKLLPEPVVFAEYLYSYLKSVSMLAEDQKTDWTQVELAMTREFIGEQLILLVDCLDTTEEGGRRRVVALMKEMLLLPKAPLALIGRLARTLLAVLRDDEERVAAIAEIISDVTEPLPVAAECLDEAEKRKKQIQLAEVKLRILERKEEMEACASREDFARAAELKGSLSELEERRRALESADKRPASDPAVFSPKDDPETLLKCLTLCGEVLKERSVRKELCPTTSALVETLVLPSVSNSNPAVRNAAVVCLGTAALHSKELAATHLVLLLQITQLDEPRIRVTALRALVDLLLLYGLDLLRDKRREAWKEDEDAEEDPAQNVLTMFSELLDSEVCELSTEMAEGLAKLMYCRRLVSVQILSRLVLLWYNPVTEGNQRLRHCLGAFLQLYARESRDNQETVERCFLPTMRTLQNAPAASPLSEISAPNVAELFVELTRPGALVRPSEGASAHSSLAMRLCHEILRDVEAPEVRLYCKTLGSLEVGAEPGPVARELRELLSEILQAVKDRFSVRAVEKTLRRLGGRLDSKSADAQLSVLAPVDENAVEVPNEEDARPRRARRGQKAAARHRKRGAEDAAKSDESDGENVPEPLPPPNTRPTRRTKAAALDEAKQDLNELLNREASP